MSRFTAPLAVTFLSARLGLAALDQPLIWEIGAEGSGAEVRVPPGFVCDGVSAPRWLWPLLPPWGHGATRAAVLHDWLLAQRAAGTARPELRERAAVDREFHRALLACGVSRPVALILLAGVRLAAARAALTTALRPSAS